MSQLNNRYPQRDNRTEQDWSQLNDTTSDKVLCQHCGGEYKVTGLKRHQASCTKLAKSKPMSQKVRFLFFDKLDGKC